MSKRNYATAVVFLIVLANFSFVFTGVSAVLIRTYDFRDGVNSKAYEGNDPTQDYSRLEIGTEISPAEYLDIANLDGRVAEYSSHAFLDYHRFRFKIFEPISAISQIYVEHQGYGRTISTGTGLTLFIWNYSTSSWRFLDVHSEGDSNGVANATISEGIPNYIDANGFLNLLAQTEQELSSCPFLYAFDGKEYVFVGDLYNRGILAVPNFPSQPEDYARIQGDQLQPTGSFYSLQVAQRYDEISYLDKIGLISIDHSPEVDIFTSLLKADATRIYTVSKHLLPLVSATDQNGKDILQQIAQKDGIYSYGAKDELKIMNLNLGDLSGARQIKLVVSGYTMWDNQKIENLARFIDVKDKNGGWVRVFENFQIMTPSALPRTYVINMTGKFSTNDYSVRIGFYPDERIDYIGVDNSPQQQIEFGSLPLVHANLHFRGYSELKGFPGLPDYYSLHPGPPESYSHPVGNFTRFGDVLPLLTDRDDKFVIMHHGDEISIDFQYSPIQEGMERDFMFYSWGYYKGRGYQTGGTVDPLPFYGMSTYPYLSNETYPFDEDHLAYLRQYNTRMYEYEAPNPQPSPHHTIYTDYVKVDAYYTGELSLTSTRETPATTGAVVVLTTVFVTATVETPVMPLPYLSLFGFLAIICVLYAVRKIRKA